MARRNQHVVPHPEGWAVKAEGSSRATRIFITQEEAIDFGREIAINQHAELVIHNRKGEVRKRRNYKKHWSHEPYKYFYPPLNYPPATVVPATAVPAITISTTAIPVTTTAADLLPAPTISADLPPDPLPPYQLPPQSTHN